jgi:tetratricopeptide (TPR) repeat protein
MRGKRSDALLPVYRRVLLLKPEPDDAAAAYRGMGDAYREIKKPAKATAAYQQALTIYQRLLRMKPQEAYVLYGLGHSHVGLGQKEQAMQVYRKLATIDKGFAQDLLKEMNNGSQETTNTGSTNTPGPNSAAAHLAQGNKYSDAKDYSNAIQSDKRAVALGPDAYAFLLLGNAQRNLKQFDQALSSFRSAVSLKANPEILATTYLQMGRVYGSDLAGGASSRS